MRNVLLIVPFNVIPSPFEPRS
ncbi:MAG: hypothetical protein K0R28_2774, partial [Paenibacillus sp.]|nr:hypothetical protein [Paenibacillus sp.]